MAINALSSFAPSKADAVSLLKILIVADSNSKSSASSAPGLFPASDLRMSSRTTDAVMKIVEILGKSGSNVATPSGNRPDAKLASAVVDSWEWYFGDAVPEAEFQVTVLESLKTTDAAKTDTALKTALANGTVTIRHAESVPGLDYKLNLSLQYGDYGLIQGAGMHQDFNRATYDHDVASGAGALFG